MDYCFSILPYICGNFMKNLGHLAESLRRPFSMGDVVCLLAYLWKSFHVHITTNTFWNIDMAVSFFLKCKYKYQIFFVPLFLLCFSLHHHHKHQAITRKMLKIAYTARLTIFVTLLRNTIIFLFRGNTTQKMFTFTAFMLDFRTESVTRVSVVILCY